MPRSRPVDGFSLEYDRAGAGPAVVLLHGWPGSRSDHRAVAALLADDADVVVPDLRGFGGSDRHDRPPSEAYSADAQADSVCGLIEELELDRPVIAGYDVGGRVAQAVARRRPDDVRALVLAPPLPGVGARVLEPQAQREFWYQPFHQLELSERLMDGDARAVRAYLEHFWSHWSAPGWTVEPERLDTLTEQYARPGAFRASIGWYRAGAGTVAKALAERPPTPLDRVAVPTAVLWPEHDPLFPLAWSDRIDEFFADAHLTVLDGIGHFVPVEAPDAMAGAIRRRLTLAG
jgi:pimeloyl-ACP methyl ester carboxylesterase